ncbi:MAG: hypothetical protein IPH75_09500 [bacterium]|nr:hypothetical protein [bacterium]
MQTILTHTIKAVRLATVAMLLLSLLVSVGYTGQGKIVCNPAKVTQVEQPTEERTLITAATTDPSGGKMTPKKSTHSIPALINAVPIVFKSADERTKLSDRPAHECAYLTAFNVEPNSGRLPLTTAMISPDLGRQATLLGAKPSGTM